MGWHIFHTWSVWDKVDRVDSIDHHDSITACRFGTQRMTLNQLGVTSWVILQLSLTNSYQFQVLVPASRLRFFRGIPFSGNSIPSWNVIGPIGIHIPNLRFGTTGPDVEWHLPRCLSGDNTSPGT